MSDRTMTYSASRPTSPVVEPESAFSLSIRLYSGYEQIVDFKLPGVAVLGLDERPPKGNGWGPSPSRLLGAALGACLGAALLAWLREHRVDVRDMRTDVIGAFKRDSSGRRTIERLDVRLIPIVASPEALALPSVAELLEASVVARSIGRGIDVHVSIVPEEPKQLRSASGARAHGSYGPVTTDRAVPFTSEGAV